MIYEYQCSQCGNRREVIRSVADRDVPPANICSCTFWAWRRVAVPSTIAIDPTGKFSMLQRAGWGWNDVQNKIKSQSGRDNTINVR